MTAYNGLEPPSLRGNNDWRARLRIPGSAGKWARRQDAELVTACLEGQSEAWDTLIERYESLIFTLAVRGGLSPTDAEDVFQDVCLILLDHLGDLRDTNRLSGWLVSVTRREIWRRFRRREPALFSDLTENGHDVETIGMPLQEAPLSPEEAFLEIEVQIQVRQALEKLPERCRNLLTLLYCTDPPCSYAEAAARLSLPLGSIGPDRARCLQRLQKNFRKRRFLTNRKKEMLGSS